MKVISTGSKFDIYPDDLKSYDYLPPSYYVVRYSDKGGFWMEKYSEFAITDAKVYGIHYQKVDKVMNSFRLFERNLGVILSGDKGIGKSLFARLLGKKAVSEGMPVIIIDKYVEDVDTFIDQINQEVMLVFDEFDKTFAGKGRDEDPQVTMLSLFDGVSPGKKLFVITCNDLHNLNGFMVNRPGRFHYHFRFDYPEASDVREYLTDALKEEVKGEIEDVIAFSNRVGLNYDCLRAIAFELNQGLSFSEAIKDVNIVNVDKEAYRLKVVFEDGSVYVNGKFFMDAFSEETMEVQMHDKCGGYAGDVYFVPDKLRFDPGTGELYADGDDVSMDYDTYDDESKEKREELRAKGLRRIIIRRLLNKRIHYDV